MARKHPCPKCSTPCYGKQCTNCRNDVVRAVLRDESERAPKISPLHKCFGEFIVASDLHVPWHDPEALSAVCITAQLLDISSLIIAGDLLHMDSISRYVGVGRSITVSEEILAAKRVLSALEQVFAQIIVIPGNHDQRIEKLLGTMDQKSLELLASLLGTKDIDDKERLAQLYLWQLLGSEKMQLYPLPDLLVNDAWLIQHPGTVSRVAPQNQRKMAEKHHKCILEGHSHLFGIGFDSSGKFVTMNMGHLSNDDNFRYKREKPSTFPNTVKGFCAILQEPDNAEGFILPLALHDRWFNVPALLRRLRRVKTPISRSDVASST